MEGFNKHLDRRLPLPAATVIRYWRTFVVRRSVLPRLTVPGQPSLVEDIVKSGRNLPNSTNVLTRHK
jgi:hypothetical protein